MLLSTALRHLCKLLIQTLMHKTCQFPFHFFFNCFYNSVISLSSLSYLANVFFRWLQRWYMKLSLEVLIRPCHILKSVLLKPSSCLFQSYTWNYYLLHIFAVMVQAILKLSSQNGNITVRVILLSILQVYSLTSWVICYHLHNIANLNMYLARQVLAMLCSIFQSMICTYVVHQGLIKSMHTIQYTQWTCWVWLHLSIADV